MIRRSFDLDFIICDVENLYAIRFECLFQLNVLKDVQYLNLYDESYRLNCLFGLDKNISYDDITIISNNSSFLLE